MPYVNVNGKKIYYVEKGSGQPLVLLHGLGSNSDSWGFQLNELSKYFRVIAWDAPGYGESSDQVPDYENFSEFADVLKEMLEALGIDSLFLLGHSMGAAIAIDFTHRFPEKVRKLIIADTPKGSTNISAEENKEKLNNRIFAIDVLGSKDLAKKRTRNLFSPNVSEELVKTGEKIMSKVRGAGYRSVSKSLYNLNQKEIYKEISVPTLLICGESDQITPLNDTKNINDQMTQSEIKIIPQAGHLCYMEEPEVFNEVVRNYLQSNKSNLK